MLTLLDLPREILLHILKLYLETEGSLSLMRTVFNVSTVFKDLCFDSSLWGTVDGNLPFSTMMMLVKNDCFNGTKNFTLSRIDEVSEKSAKTIFSRLKNVNTLDLSAVKKIKGDIFELIASNCPKLSEIRLGKHGNDSTAPKRVNYSSLSRFLTVQGLNLLSLDISYCIIQNLSLVLRCIADCCPNLEELFLVSVYSNTAFPTKYMQMKCQKLKVLCLDHNVRPSKQCFSEGFPHLTSFSFFDPDGKIMYDQEFSSLLFNSPNLNVLNISTCNVSSDAVCQLPATGVEYLNLSRSKVCMKDLEKVIEKWCFSLKELNVSYCKSSTIDKVISKLVAIPDISQLEVLNLSYTLVGFDVIKSVLDKCHKLRILHLESCRNLSRGMKRVYYGTKELDVLKRNIDLITKPVELD